MKKKLKMSWTEFDDCVDKLIYMIKKDKLRYDGIFGIPKGGLPLATVLSYKLNLPLLLYPTNKTLVADDISDTGKTLENLKYKKIVTLYYTPWTKVCPHYTTLLKDDEESWIVFPWEANDEKV